MMTKLRKIEIEDDAMGPASALPNVEEFFTPLATEMQPETEPVKPTATRREDDRQLFAVPRNGWLSGMRNRLVDA